MLICYTGGFFKIQNYSNLLFVPRLSEAEQEADPVVAKLFESTEEGQKVSRNAGEKWCAVFQRIADPYTADTS